VRIAFKRSERLLGLLAIAVVMNDHTRALVGELSRGGPPDALGGAGDKDDLVFEIHGSSENRFESARAVSSARFFGAPFFLFLNFTSPLNQCLSRDAQEFRDFRAGLVL